VTGKTVVGEEEASHAEEPAAGERPGEPTLVFVFIWFVLKESLLITRPARPRTKTPCGGLGATRAWSFLTQYSLLVFVLIWVVLEF